jgi:hypothetical protein
MLARRSGETGIIILVRSLILTLALLPYLYYGTLDNLYHFRGRRVSLAEHLLHLGVGITIVGAIASAYRGRLGAMLGCLLLFLVSGATDEFIYHRGLPEHETDLHAKGHMALLLFVIVAVATQFFAGHPWAASVGIGR